MCEPVCPLCVPYSCVLPPVYRIPFVRGIFEVSLGCRRALQCWSWDLARPPPPRARRTMLGLEALDSPKTPRLGAQLRLRRSSGSASDDSFTSSSPSPARDVEQLGSPSHAAAPAASSRSLSRQPSLNLDQYAAVLTRAALSRQSTAGNLEIEQLTSLDNDEGAAAGQQQEGRGSLDGIVQFSAEPEGPPIPILAPPTLLSRQQAAKLLTALVQTGNGASAETPEHEGALAAAAPAAPAAPAPAAARAFFNSPNVGRRPGSLSPAAATAATAKVALDDVAADVAAAAEAAAARDEAAALAEELAALEEEEKTFEAWVQAEEAAIAAEEARLAAIEAEETRAMAEAAAAAAAAAYSAATKKSGALFMDEKPGCQIRDSSAFQIRDSPGGYCWCSPIAVPASVIRLRDGL